LTEHLQPRIREQERAIHGLEAELEVALLERLWGHRERPLPQEPDIHRKLARRHSELAALLKHLV